MPSPPSTVPDKPPADDYQETIAALKKQIEKLTANLEEANREIANKDETIYELEEVNQEFINQNEELSKKLAGEIEKNDVLYTQVNNLTHERDNLTYELNLSKKQADEAVRMAQIPFINGWVYDNDRGWIFTDAGLTQWVTLIRITPGTTLNSAPRYFFNFTSNNGKHGMTYPRKMIKMSLVTIIFKSIFSIGTLADIRITYFKKGSLTHRLPFFMSRFPALLIAW